ncbi:MAG TPA: Spy/CpxP family protein refolding chaperone [Thermoanaerobaculia bacterium]|jgi:Spy/CpxP family protein refolding chaperone
MKRSFVALALLVLVVAGTAAFAQRGPHHGPPPPEGAGAPMIPGLGPDPNAVADYLGLTAAQRTAWQTVQSELRASTQALREQQHTLAEQLHTALEGSDATAIGNLVLQLKALHGQLDAARDAAEAKFSATLTPEQQTKFAALLAAADYLRERGPGRGPRH